MESLMVIEKVASKLAPGRAPSFIEVHVMKTLETLSAGKDVGRIKLSRILGLGEGATRTLIKHLRNEGLVEVSRSGIVLSRFGEKVWSDIRTRIGEEIEIPRSSLTIGDFNIALLIRDAAGLVKYGVEQRDAAIKVGALGATTFVFRSNKLTMPGVGENFLQKTWAIHDSLISTLKPRENDVIIIGSANEKRIAEFGVKTAALTLLRKRSQESQT